MDSTIQAMYANLYTNAAAQPAKQKAAASGSFLELARQVSHSSVPEQEAIPSAAGAANENCLYLNMAAQYARSLQMEQVPAPCAVSLEELLRAKYPDLVYHVFDASGSAWRTRNDYPHYLLYQPGNQAAEILEHWQPSGDNPEYSASQAIRALEAVPAGRTAVVIHPAVQERTEQDPDYTHQMLARIDAWLTFDIARSEVLTPGITARISRSVAIGEKGEIVNTQSFSRPQADGSEHAAEAGDWWEQRMEQHASFFQLMERRQRTQDAKTSGQNTGLGAYATAEDWLAGMMGGGTLRELLGETIAGTPTETVLTLTQRQVWGL